MLRVFAISRARTDNLGPLGSRLPSRARALLCCCWRDRPVSLPRAPWHFIAEPLPCGPARSDPSPNSRIQRGRGRARPIAAAWPDWVPHKPSIGPASCSTISTPRKSESREGERENLPCRSAPICDGKGRKNAAACESRHRECRMASVLNQGGSSALGIAVRACNRKERLWNRGNFSPSTDFPP